MNVRRKADLPRIFQHFFHAVHAADKIRRHAGVRAGRGHGVAEARLRLDHRHVVGRVGRDDHDFKHDFPRKLQRVVQNPHLVRHERGRRSDHARNVALIA